MDSFSQVSEAPSAAGTARREFSTDQVANIASRLEEGLEKGELSTRRGSGNQNFTYIESWRVFDLCNGIFGFNGWSSTVQSLLVDHLSENDNKRWTAVVTAQVRVELRDGTYHEDIGMGVIEGAKSVGMALEQAKKTAVSDGVKRATRYFGKRLGNCIYDKNFLTSLRRPNSARLNQGSASTYSPAAGGGGGSARPSSASSTSSSTSSSVSALASNGGGNGAVNGNGGASYQRQAMKPQNGVVAGAPVAASPGAQFAVPATPQGQVGQKRGPPDSAKYAAQGQAPPAKRVANAAENAAAASSSAYLFDDDIDYSAINLPG